MKPQTVLLVDDDDALRDVVQMILEHHGYRVIAFARGFEALRVAGNELVDLVLTDIGLPGASGDVLAERLRERNPKLRFVYMSGDPDKVPRGAHHVLAKPFRRENLIQKVREALDS